MLAILVQYRAWFVVVPAVSWRVPCLLGPMVGLQMYPALSSPAALHLVQEFVEIFVSLDGKSRREQVYLHWSPSCSGLSEKQNGSASSPTCLS